MIVLHCELKSSKNSRRVVRLRNGRTLVLKSQAASEQDKFFDKELPAHAEEWQKMIEGHSNPIKVGFYVYRQTKRRWDWMNILQGLADAMVKHMYLEDDDAYHFTPIFLGWDVDKNDPRIEISVVK